jgi:hypothetical protein
MPQVEVFVGKGDVWFGQTERVTIQCLTFDSEALEPAHIIRKSLETLFRTTFTKKQPCIFCQQFLSYENYE